MIPMKPLIGLLCLCLLLGTACRKSRNAATNAPDAPSPAVASQPKTPTSGANPAAAAGSPATAAVAASINAQHFSQLSQALLTFRRDKQRAPKDWQELIATGYLKQMPTPPAGKRYIFNPASLDVHMVN